MMKLTAVLYVGLALLLGATSAPADGTIEFATQIQPIFIEHCAKCHGADKAQGKMRLHTVAAIQEELAADPQLLVAGDPDKSELFQRLVLPEKNPKRMPKGADPLTKDTIELIGNWIRQGAALPATASAATPSETTDSLPSEAPKLSTAEENLEASKSVVLPNVRIASRGAIDQLTAVGAQVIPLFAGSSLLQITFAHGEKPAGDAEVALLSGVAEQAYSLDLAGAKVSASGLAPLATLKNLTELHLERSSITDEGLAHVAGLSKLQYLNLYGTAISDTGLKHLADLDHLERLYLRHTKVSYDAAVALEKHVPGLTANLGYDHPVVARMRLSNEIETVRKRAEEARADIAKAEQELETAKKNVAAAEARVMETERELKKFESPTDNQGDAPTGKPGGKADEKSSQ